MTGKVEGAPHGTAGGYINWKCRCDECRKAHRVSATTRARARRAQRHADALALLKVSSRMTNEQDAEVVREIADRLGPQRLPAWSRLGASERSKGPGS